MKQTKYALRIWRLTLGGLLLAATLSACSTGLSAVESKERQAKAQAMFAQRCQTAGEKIHRTVEDVEGIFLMKLRSGAVIEDQFALDDPYGRDLGGDGYIGSFVRGSFQANNKDIPVGAPPRLGFLYVEAIEPADGQRYRYTGRIEEPWQTNKSFLKGYTRFVLDKQVSINPRPRFGVTYDDISTLEDRQYWIAGSSLKVIDLETNEVLAERVGYMVDIKQGDRAGGRVPWLFAADHACPAFGREFKGFIEARGHGSASMQARQTQDFVEKVLRPKQDKGE